MPNAVISALKDELVKVVGERYVLSTPLSLALYECDAETMDVARPDLVVLPKNTSEVQRVVELANKYAVPFTARGAATGLSGGATTIYGGISLVLTRMNRILRIEAKDMFAEVEAGATNLSVSQAAAPYGLYFAPDPSSQSASTIGGNLAENSGGPHTLKYGMTIHHILSAKVVLPDGSLTTFGGKAKDKISLDLLGLMVGSEGTLGIATEATVRLLPKSRYVETMLVYFPTVATGGQAVSDIVAHGVIPAAMEMIDSVTLNAVEDYLHMGLNRAAGCLLIVELDGPQESIHVQRQIVESVVKDNGALSLTWAKDDKERALIWKARKTSFGALGRIAPHGYVLDGVIPRSKLKEAIEKIAEIGEKHQLTIANVYHAGDGNLHPCLLYHRENEDEVRRVMLAGREILELCVELGGTLSGEHGIGIEKVHEMPMAFAEKDLQAMTWVKNAFDPRTICNPGKIIPQLKSCGESGMRPLLRHKLLSGC
ncbi:MAG TPA: FAD-linked oxidase C-terminal domain-containing protein [Candidatus Melainabacteria bacterium]|nr:FAD-linked oxidase C-terminal domain-containing protein [Candidatus Melainabacteria bacterium]